MNFAALTNSHSVTTLGPSLADVGRRGAPGFAEALAAAGRSTEDDRAAQEREVQQAAQQFVATAFVMPLLAQARQSPFKTELFHGGQGEEMFGQQLDQRIADQIVRRMDFPLIHAVQKHVFRHTQGPRTGGQVNTHG